MASDNRAPVTVIGLGLMGTALATAFLKAGYPTTVWNRSAEKADDLVAEGATRADTVADAVSASTVVVACVADYDAMQEVLGVVGDAVSGRVLVNLTSGTPEQARELAGWAAEHGVNYLDGAIMAIPPSIGRPEAVILYSGSQEAFEAHESALTTLGTSTYLGTDPGVALLYDLALLGIMWSTLSGFYHAAALLSTSKMDATAFAPMAAQWLSVIATFLPNEARMIDEGNYATDISTLDINATAIDHLVRASQAQGLSVNVPGPIKALIDRAVVEGHGSESMSVIVEQIKKPTSPT